jgi:type VI protein secretion system component Hcp
MSQSDKPTSKQPETKPTDKTLPETELDKVSGGKGNVGDIVFTKHYDKSSPNLG